jgi:hypothetical protein
MNVQVIKNRIRKVLTYTVTSITFLVITGFLVLQIPAVQEHFIKRYLRQFSDIVGFRSTVGSFELLWFDRLRLDSLVVYDPENNKMIAAKEVLINFKLQNLLEQNDINIDGVALENAEVFLAKIQESDTSRDLNINVFINRINQHFAAKNTGGRTPRINIGEAVLNQSLFTYIDQYRDSVKQGFNYNQFSVMIDESQLQNFMIQGDTTQFNVNTLLATDKDTRFQIKQLSTFFRLSQQSMEFLGLNLKAGESSVSDTIVFTFNGQHQLSDFIPNVNIHANLRNTIIRPRDLALFAPQAKSLPQPLYISGIFDGTVEDFDVQKMEVGMGKTMLRGFIEMEGLPDINETFIALNVKNSRVDFNDLAFLLNDQVLSRLTPLGRLTLEGEFLGYPTDFVAKGDFSGPVGKIVSDINFKVNERNFDRSVYSGKLELNDFKLGQYLKDSVNFQEVTLSGNIKGSGVTRATADFKLNGSVKSIGIRGYNYQNITTNARFASQFFNGLFKINDPNLKLLTRGSIDLRDGFNVIKMQAELDTAFVHNLKLTNRELFLHADLDINIKGLHLDSLVGRVDVTDFKIYYNDRWMTQKEIHLVSEKTAEKRNLYLRTNVLDASVRGDFLMTDITKDVQTLVKEIILNVKNDQRAIASYYAAKSHHPKSYNADFGITLKDLKPIDELLDLKLKVSENTTIEGKFTSGYTSILQAFVKIDSVNYNNSLFLDTDVELTASKISDSTSVLAMAFVNSDRQLITPKFITRNLVAEAIWNQDHIDFSLDGDQEGQTNYVRLTGTVDFMRDSTRLKFQKSKFQILEKIWEFEPNNSITIHQKDIRFEDLVMRHENQFIAADGVISTDPEKRLSLHINDFSLALLNPIIGRDISGVFNAMFDLTNFYRDPYVENDIKIDSLTIDNFLIGDITGKNQWDTLSNKFLIDFFVDRTDKRIVDVEGFYNPSHESSPLNLTAKLRDANLKILEPFLDDLFTNIQGTVSGDFRINGTLKKPGIEGEGQVGNGELMFNYLKTQYRFTGTIGLSPNSIYFKDIDLFDTFNNRGTLRGTITHDNFYSMRVNIDAAFNNFQVLNTTPKDNSLFYGQGYATGDLNVFGPVANIKITANARTDRNTRIFIPISGTSEIAKQEFIKFVSFTDSTFQKSLQGEITNKVDLTGITLDFNLDVTPDAYCEIIFDLKAGDIIRGRGNGELQLQLNTLGEFNMFGPFEFTEGWYNFTLYDIINKDFVIHKGSRINWYGDPYGAVLDIRASYNQLASIAPILTNQELSTHPMMRRKYPVEVLLNLKGEMLSPDFTFDIVANDLPQSITVDNEYVRPAFEFQAFKNRMDEQELYRQVFSLIILRRFSPPESFNTSGSLANSVSELFSNQLSNWVSQVDENLEIDVDLSTFDQDAFNTFQLRLSYTFLNGRLRVTRDATTFYGNQNNTTVTQQQQNSIASIAGDWTVDYLLTADGKLRVKMYNRTNINPIFNNLGSQNPVTTGVSITHMQSFNELKDLWRAARNRRKQSQPDGETDANDKATKKDDDGE